MTTVEITLSTPKHGFSLFSWLIRFLLRSKYSHSSMHFGDELTGQRLVSQSSNGESHEILYDKWLLDNKIIKSWSIRVDENQYRGFRAMSNELKQVPYSRFWGIIGVGLHVISRGKIAIFEDGIRSLYCSESDVYKLRELGIYFLKDRNFITPLDIDIKMSKMADAEPKRVKECYING